jgi:hypothetical protein
MTQEPATQQSPPQVIIDATPKSEVQTKSEEQAIEFMKEMQENAGQISELAAEEENLVTQFFNSMLKIFKPFGKTVEITLSALPEKYHGQVSKAYLYVTGQLILVYANGEIEILNLAEKENHDILVEITSEIMMQLKSVISAYRLRTEKRVKFLMPITKELQKIAEVFSEK